MYSGEFPASLTIMYTEHQESGMQELVNHGSYSSSSSPSSYSATQRSVSSHSLPPMNNNMASSSYPPGMRMLGGTHRLVDLIDSCSVRRVFSAGDLQLQMQERSSESGLWSKHESSSSSIIEGMLSKACRYSPEEKKERIERYKSKRGQRNFSKKIKYACRKTLADSRPRIRGRFARNKNNEDDEEVAGGVDEEEYKCGAAVHGWGGSNRDEWDENEDEEVDNWVDLFNAAWCA